jgi:hypothetical protein
VVPGLNLKGRCSNQNCNAFKHQVSWIRKGFGTFEIGRDKCRNVCASCKQKISPLTVKSLGFYKCRVEIVGMKEEND